MIVVMNFQAEEQTVEVNVSGLDFDEMTDLESSAGSHANQAGASLCQAMGIAFCG